MRLCPKNQATEDNGKKASPDLGRPSNPSENSKPNATGQKSVYMVIPIAGTIGEDVTPSGLYDALDHARRKHIEQVVLWIDSRGGRVEAHEDFKTILRQFDEHFVLVAVIQECISAAMPFALMADRAFVLESSRAGAAVSFMQNSRTGEVAVDAKMNSAWAAEFAALAQAKGRSPVLARAMVVMAEQVWVCNETAVNQSSMFASEEEAKKSCTTPHRIDGPETVLTLTGQELVEYGMAEGFVSGEEDLGRALGLQGWKRLSRYGDTAMQKAAGRIQQQIDGVKRDCDKLQAELSACRSLPDAIQRSVSEADALHPSRFNYLYDTRSGELSPQSKRDWRDRTDRAIQSWESVLGRIDHVVMLERQASKFIQECDNPSGYFLIDDAQAEAKAGVILLLEELRQLGQDLAASRREAESAIADLRRDRDRNRL